MVEAMREDLFRSWPRLAERIETGQDDLRLLRQVRQAATEWDRNNCDTAFLWPDERLQSVYAMSERLQPDLDEITRAFIRPETERLLVELDDIDTIHARRPAIGERLAMIGDPCPGVGLRPDGLPDIVWCNVPGGIVTLESNTGTFEIAPFQIARYPITFIQFQAFLDDPEGFENEVWWDGLAEEYRIQAMNVQRNKYTNYPRDSVSWYQAIAFARWLNAKLPSEAWPVELPDGSEMPKLVERDHSWIIRLPTEWEWEQAATGGNLTNEYPWESEWDAHRTNTNEAGIGRATAVGMYPSGISPVGALDMSGNVWEWCLNEHGQPVDTGLGGENLRAVRDGAFSNDQNNARCTYRNSLVPHLKDNFHRLSGSVCAFLISMTPCHNAGFFKGPGTPTRTNV